MLLITRRLATGLLLVPIGGIRFAGATPDATARITLILVNDIYLMADELMPDGQRRGGFARLAAVVKAERAKAGATTGGEIGDPISPVQQF
jgi:5'-nucleotidase / UDP-sugar diphosphatase